MVKNSTVVRIGSIAVLALWQAACVPKPAPTVDYYRAHAQEREAQMKRCANDPGSIGSSPACTNALQANELEKPDSIRTLPPMGLPMKKDKVEDKSPSQ
jgi:hypothetical protein